PAVDHFLLAEKGYESEFNFYRGGWTVVENKVVDVPLSVKTREPQKVRLLFSGTLAASTGVFQAINLAMELNTLDPDIELTVIGYAALDSEREKILAMIKVHPWINLIGGDKLVPHREVLEAMQHADAGILLYPQSAHTLNSHPTKLFEYLNARIPIILENQWPWIERYASCKPFIFFNSNRPDYAGLLDALKNEKFYVSPPVDVTWASEERKLLEAIVQ
ncbi:MAG TPA: hypothetical protein PLR06_13440, partial [Cyclobacteriaceae bacterium]|nr:hypothetical protein [Cyclobacteriaceae bacterium]